MGNYISLDGKFYNLSDDSSKSSQEVIDINTIDPCLCNLSTIQTKVALTDSTVVVLDNAILYDGIKL